MKNSIKIIFFVFVLLNSSSYAENTDKFEGRDFFCCSIYDLYKTDSTKNNNNKIKKKILPAKNKIEDTKIIKTNTNEINIVNSKVKPFDEKNNIVNVQQQIENNIFSKKSQDHIEVEADESYWHEKKQLTILQGDTKIIRGNETIKSELTNYLQNENRARLSGNVQYNADGIEVNAPYAEYDTKEARTDFISPKYKYSSLNITGKARYGVRLKNKKMFLKNSTYTTCNLINPDWNLISKTTELDFEKGVGTGKNVFLTVRGVPVFFTPYMRFSLDEQRKTGFLIPEWSGSWAKGPDVFTPFYWNIASNMDMLIQPSYLQDRGSRIETTFRYLKKEFDGAIYISYLGDDSTYIDDRYKVLVDHKHQVNPNLLINTHYERLSDKDYYNDFGTGIAGVSSTYGSRYIEAIYEYNDWKIYGEFLGYQTFDKSLTSESEPVSYTHLTLPTILLV